MKRKVKKVVKKQVEETLNESKLTDLLAIMLTNNKAKEIIEKDPYAAKNKELVKNMDAARKYLNRFKKWAITKRPNGMTNYEYYSKLGFFDGTVNWDNV